MASVTDWLGDEVTFSHDGDGNPTGQDNAVSTSKPAGTSSTSLSYDAAGSDDSGGLHLGPDLRRLGDPDPSFAGTGGSRNADGQLTQYSATYTGSCSGQGPTQRYYTYDPAGRVIYQGPTTQGSAVNTFAYDPSGDPTTLSEHAGGSFDTFNQTFDAAGEVTTQNPAAGSGGSATAYAYDTLGDLTGVASGSTTLTYGYDQAGRLTTATSAASSASYLYDGDGLEAASQPAQPGALSQLTWDVNGSLALLLSDGANDYVYGPGDTPLEQVTLDTSTATYMTYVSADSTWITTNGAGDQTGFWGYDAYGTLAYGTPATAFGYAGQCLDASTGLSDMRARWYQPQTGEFTTRDPAFLTHIPISGTSLQDILSIIEGLG